MRRDKVGGETSSPTECRRTESSCRHDDSFDFSVRRYVYDTDTTTATLCDSWQRCSRVCETLCFFLFWMSRQIVSDFSYFTFWFVVFFFCFFSSQGWNVYSGWVGWFNGWMDLEDMDLDGFLEGIFVVVWGVFFCEFFFSFSSKISLFFRFSFDFCGYQLILRL